MKIHGAKPLMFIAFLILISIIAVFGGVESFGKDLDKINHSAKLEKKYRNGVLVKTKLVDEKGKLYKEIIHGWAKGRGINRIYYPNGTVKEEYCFEKGHILRHRKFDDKGRLLFDSINHAYGSRQDREFYANGRLKKELTYEGLRFASLREYDQGGNLVKEFIRKNIPED